MKQIIGSYKFLWKVSVFVLLCVYFRDAVRLLKLRQPPDRFPPSRRKFIRTILSYLLCLTYNQIIKTTFWEQHLRKQRSFIEIRHIYRSCFLLLKRPSLVYCFSYYIYRFHLSDLFFNLLSTNDSTIFSLTEKQECRTLLLSDGRACI